MSITHRNEIDDLDVFYSNSGVEVFGGVMALHNFADAVVSGESIRLRNSRPSTRQGGSVALKELAVIGSLDKVYLRVENDKLRVGGDLQGRSHFAKSIRSFAEGQIAGAANHLHLEYYPDHPWISEESLPVILHKL